FTPLPGRQADLREELRAFEAQFSLLDSGQALERGLFGHGEPHPAVRSRIGEIIALALRDACLWRSDTPAEVRRVRGLHGGLSEAEMLLPLLSVGLDAL